MDSRRLWGALTSIAFLLCACSPSLKPSTMSLLKKGSPKVCSAEDVQDTLRGLIFPSNGPDYSSDDPVVRRIVDQAEVTFELTTLEKFDDSIGAVTCSTNVKLKAGDRDADLGSVEFMIQPAAENPSEFIIRAQAAPTRALLMAHLIDAIGRARSQQPQEADPGDAAPAEADDESRADTRFGPLEVKGDLGEQTLFFNGEQIKPVIAGNNFLNIAEVYQGPTSDLALLTDIGGSSCPMTLKVLEVSQAGRQVSEDFGTCTDIYEATFEGGKLTVKMGPFGDNSERHTYVISGTQVTDNGLPLDATPLAPSDDG